MKLKYLIFSSVVLFSAGVCVLLWNYKLDYRGVVWLYLYSIPSHVYISFLPHEPVLLFYGKSFNIWAAVVAATLGTLIAGFIDYETLGPLLRHKKIKNLYDNKNLYQRAVKFFYKAPFWMVVIAGFTPIPFYPFKFLSIASNYSQHKYLLALLVGRAPRYFLLIWLGYTIKIPDWLLIAAFALMFAWGGYGYLKDKLKKRSIAEQLPFESSESPGEQLELKFLR
ncbi:MAG: VTT domain-containing protein [candidate division KSB1 bacterium]|nr:VTT domain-containing protein [candidate division KSB1 bacterium]MDZ7319529.1 VTT domain-containing protein [candidate division KSB1 bacterium]MDZ7341159.1 VTT domain-containing protein [candidate division KSB1 bacterium]